MTTDDVLLAMFRRGDRPAAEELFERHVRPVQAALARRCGPALAEEAVQEVVTRLWERPERFDSDRGSLRAFLTRDATCRTIDWWRSDAAASVRAQRAVQPPAAVQPEDASVSEASAHAIRSALGQLTDAQREAICLAFYGGLSYREVARRLGVAEGTIKTRIRAALLQLRAALTAEGWQPGLVD